MSALLTLLALLFASALSFLLTSCGGDGSDSTEACIRTVDPSVLNDSDSSLDLVDRNNFDLKKPSNIRVMTVNVGNGSIASATNIFGVTASYDLRIKHQSYEDFIGTKIRALKPEIIALQEVLPFRTCVFWDGSATKSWETNSAYTCFDATHRADAVRRILGDDYSIVCDARLNVDCLGVHKDFAAIDGLSLGGYQFDGAETPAFPPGFSACDYTKGDCKVKAKNCDQESNVAAVTLTTRASSKKIRVVFLHPTAAGEACQHHQLLDAFELAKSAGDIPTLLLGDWNTDPVRMGDAGAEAIWYAHVGPKMKYRDHDERDDSCARVTTSPGVLGIEHLVSIDHVVSNFLKGFCRVWHEDYVPVGASSPWGRFDADFGESIDPKKTMDHAAVQCDLYWPEGP